jgi:transcriptional regulator with XRE-family HTH domain
MADMTLRQARELVKLTQAELAARAGLERSAIHDLEAGRNRRPSWDTVFRVTTALRDCGLAGITPEQLFPVERVA